MEVKKILPGVPEMRYGNPSAVCFIGSVLRLLEYIGDPAEEDEVFALSGAGLCFPWQFATSCDEIGIIPEIPARTFQIYGWIRRLTPPFLTSRHFAPALSEKRRRTMSVGLKASTIRFNGHYSCPDM